MRCSTARPCVVDCRNNRRHSAQTVLNDLRCQSRHGLQATEFAVDGAPAPFEFADLGDQRRRITARFEGADQPGNARLHICALVMQRGLLVARIVAFGQLHYLLHGFGCQGVLFDGW